VNLYLATAYVVDWDKILRWLPITSAVATMIALIVTMTMTRLANNERATFEMIDKVYSLCHTLHGHLIREWQLIHLFTTTEASYWSSRRHIDGDYNEEQCKQWLEKERLLAIHIFIAYEQVYFHYCNTAKYMRGRRRFLEQMLSYFTERVLNNPRLKALFQADMTGASLHLEKPSARYLASKLTDSTVDADPVGPFVCRKANSVDSKTSELP